MHTPAPIRRWYREYRHGGFVSELVHVCRGLWRSADSIADLPSHAAALLSVLPSGTVVGGRSAGAVHGLWLPAGLPDRVEMLLRPACRPATGHSGSRHAAVHARRRVLTADEIVVVQGVPVTSLERTWVDLAEFLTPADLVAAGDSALRLGATTEGLDRAVRRAFHRRGVVRARTTLPFLDARSRSRPESHLRYAIVSSGLPVPAVNRPIHDSQGGWLAEPDLSYDDVRLAIEYNGADHAGIGRMRRDITREVDLSLRGGWHTVVFGPAEVFGRPDQAVAEIRHLRWARARIVS